MELWVKCVRTVDEVWWIYVRDTIVAFMDKVLRMNECKLALGWKISLWLHLVSLNCFSFIVLLYVTRTLIIIVVCAMHHKLDRTMCRICFISMTWSGDTKNNNIFEFHQYLLRRQFSTLYRKPIIRSLPFERWIICLCLIKNHFRVTAVTFVILFCFVSN